MGFAARRGLCWLRRDLRLHDHPALAAATSECLQTAVAFVFDSALLSRLADKDDRRVTFIFRSLQELDRKLQSHGSKLIVLHGKPEEEIPRLAHILDAERVYAAEGYQSESIRRDQEVERRLRADGREWSAVQDSVLIRPGEVLTRAGKPYTVFTPFCRAWLEVFSESMLSTIEPNLERLLPESEMPPLDQVSALSDIGFREACLCIEPGEDAAVQTLDDFSVKIGSYKALRDFPASNATSVLSPHIRFGTISLRRCFIEAFREGGEGAESWRSELIWREFFRHICELFPDRLGKSFRPEFESIEWPGKETHFLAWCDGQTGYPTVDAAMRCLRETGWMHNRLRMIAASFLTKDLLVDWRKGEAHFARYLLDFEPSSNNGGWQWAASTGCDAQPYFRIFNPELQSRKFDPEGEFIRRWCPEIAALSSKSIHAPWKAPSGELADANCRIGEKYPEPIVDHATQRNRSLALLGSAKRSAF